MQAPHKFHPAIPQATLRHDPASPHSIRRQLERDAWRRYPRLALRLARHRARSTPAQRKLRWQDRTLLIVGITLMLLLLLRIETAVAQEHDWGLQLQTGAGHEQLLSLNTVIHAEVTGLTARVQVVQVFRNDSTQWAEGTYRFPLPADAAVDQLLIKVGERVLEGEIQERLVAQRTYQRAAAAGHTASLVEQERPNQFSSKLTNIGPGEDILVMIGFLVNVAYRDGEFSLRLPMTFNRRWGGEPQPGIDTQAAHPVHVSLAEPDSHGLQMEISLLTDLGFAAIESRYHDVRIDPVNEGYRVTLDHHFERTDRDFELAWYPDWQASPQSSLMSWQGDDAWYAQLMLVPPANEALQAQAREVIFIIDTSGSMEGASLAQARAALLRGLEQLGPADRFNLVRFSSDTDSLFREPVPATSRHIQQTREYIQTLIANGGTVMAPALEAALTMPAQAGLVRQVVFVTDGSVGNEKELLAFVAELLGEARVFTVGIGSAPNSWFMRKLAEIGRGNHTHIGKLDEVEERMSHLWTRIRLPAIQDICVDWGQAAEYYPEVIPDLYAGEPLWLVARLPGAPQQVNLCGQLNGRAWQHELLNNQPVGNDTLATLWARRKIEALQDSLVFGADPELMRMEVTSVALDYHLLTPHTSLVAVDRTPARPMGEQLATGQIPSLLPAGSTSHSAGFPATATGWKTQWLLSTLLMLISGALFWNPSASLRRRSRSNSRSPIAASLAARSNRC